MNKAINGDAVNQMNSRGRHIIHSLFDLYKEDPYCLPSVYKNRLSQEIRETLKDTKKYLHKEIEKKEDFRVICDCIASLTDQEAIEGFRAILT